MWFQIIKKFKKGKKKEYTECIGGEKIPKQQTKHKGSMFQVYYSDF